MACTEPRPLNTFGGILDQTPIDTFQHVAKSLCGRVKALIGPKGGGQLSINGHGFGMGYLTSSY